MISLHADGPNKSFTTGEITEDGFYAFHDTKYDEMHVGRIYIENDYVSISGMIEMTFDEFKKDTLPRMEWVKLEYIGKSETEDAKAKEAARRLKGAVALYKTILGLQGQVFKNKEIVDGKVVDLPKSPEFPIPFMYVNVRIALGRDDIAGKIYSEPQLGFRYPNGFWAMMFPPMKDGVLPLAPFHVTDDMVLDFEYCPPRKPHGYIEE